MARRQSCVSEGQPLCFDPCAGRRQHREGRAFLGTTPPTIELSGVCECCGAVVDPVRYARLTPSERLSREEERRESARRLQLLQQRPARDAEALGSLLVAFLAASQVPCWSGDCYDLWRNLRRAVGNGPKARNWWLRDAFALSDCLRKFRRTFLNHGLRVELIAERNRRNGAGLGLRVAIDQTPFTAGSHGAAPSAADVGGQHG